MRECLPQCQRLGALGEHDIRHGGPHLRGAAFLLDLLIRLQPSNAPAWFLEVVAQDANAGSNRGIVGTPYVLPLPILAAPKRALLSSVLASSLGDEPETIDRGLNGHDLPLRLSVPPLDGIDLPR